MNRALATVDLECVRHNVEALRQRLSPKCRLMAVVKADGYGHGAVPVARASLEAGAAVLGVATAGEALELREAGLDCAAGRPRASDRRRDLESALDAGAEILIWSLPFLKNLLSVAHARDAVVRLPRQDRYRHETPGALPAPADGIPRHGRARA